MQNNQKAHFWVLLGLTVFFYLCSAVSSLAFAKHWVATDFLNPMATDYFRALMLVSLAMLDPKGEPAGAGPLPPAARRAVEDVADSGYGHGVGGTDEL
jgi:hypothetical protein